MSGYLSITAPGFRSLKGKVISKDANSITFNYKRPRSSKYEETVVPNSRVIYLYESDGDDYLVTIEVASEIDGVKTTGKVSFKDGFAHVTSVDGGAYTVAERFFSLVNEAEEAKGGKKKAAKVGKVAKAGKADAAGKKKKKKAK